MIGNDVIDLRLASAESNPLRQGWWDKVFDESEQHQLSVRENTRLIWEFWAMKESAYKAHVRQGGDPGFYPARIICDAESGTARIGTAVYHCQVLTFDGRISVRAAIDKIILGQIVTIDHRNIVKIGRLPYFKVADALIPASLSHHGRFTEAVTIAG